MAAIPIPEEFFKLTIVHDRTEFDDVMRMASEEYDRTISAKVQPNCTTCGTFAGCVCVRPMATMTVHCYVCGAQHDPRVPAPRVCESCVRRYL